MSKIEFLVYCITLLVVEFKKSQKDQSEVVELTVWEKPFSNAFIKAVFPFKSFALTSAPLSTVFTTISVNPFPPATLNTTWTYQTYLKKENEEWNILRLETEDNWLYKKDKNFRRRHFMSEMCTKIGFHSLIGKLFFEWM